MSDEESFVILGTSPMASLQPDGINGADGDKVDSMQKHTPSGSSFTSLKKHQLNELENAREASNKTPTPSSLSNSNGIDKSMTKSGATVISNTASSLSTSGGSSNATMERSAESLLWCRPDVETISSPPSPLTSRTLLEPTPDVGTISGPQSSLWARPQVEVKDDFIPLSLEDCAVPSTLTKKPVVEPISNPQTSLSSRPQLEPTPDVEPISSPQTSVWAKPQVEVKDNFISFTLEDFAVPSTLTQSPKTSLTSRPSQVTSSNPPTSLKQNSNKENLQPSLETLSNMTNSQNSKGAPSSKNSSLAASFIMGEVNADVLKTSVYSQFPSITMQACAEDVVKLQNMVTEYMQLKTTLEKVNNTMKLFYENSLQWKDKMNHMECHYKQQLDECQKQIEDLRVENTNLKKSIEEQVEQTKAVDVARQNDREEMIRTISEKTALVENMRAMIVKLEEQQADTYEFLPKKPKDKKENNFDNLYITRGEHELEVKDLKRQLSEMLASNLDLKDVEKQYIDELNCLKQNATLTEELVKQHRAEIVDLQVADATKIQTIFELQKSNKEILAVNVKQNERILHLEQQNQDLLAANSEQNERILLLEHQNLVHCKDFEMERESRQTAVGEKQQILQDLRALQKRNQELIEEHQVFVENYEKRLTNSSMGNGFGSATTPLVAAAAAAQTYINNPQRPIRDLPTANQSGMANQVFDSSNQYNCPVCNKRFKSISVLTSHVNDCIDKN